jgi:hypothetical protein
MIVMPISWLARVGHEAAFREALRKGASLVVAVGYTYSAPVAAVARDFPDVEFTVIDGDAAGPNIQTVTEADRRRCRKGVSVRQERDLGEWGGQSRPRERGGWMGVGR